MIKLHRVLVQAVISALTEIFENGRQADKVIEQVLKSDPRWGARDRGFIAENVYEIVRWQRLLEFVGQLTHLASYQAFGTWQVLKGNQLPDWPEFSKINVAQNKARQAEAQTIRKIRESIPDWLDELGGAELGNDWDSEISALNQTARAILRTNTLKTNRDELQKILSKVAIHTETVSELPDALILKEKKNVFQTEYFKNGFFEVQDGGSQLIAPFLDVRAGMRVVDACAGAGGKTLHLAALMQNKGHLIAMDVEARKLEELKRRSRRNGVSNVETRLIEPKTIKRLRDSADRLLLDVPCSGLGVLRRNPDAKWKMKPDFLDKIRQTQFEIITDYSRMVKTGGKMVYATCSILPSESEHQVQRFLSEQPNWTMTAERRASPARDGFDGFYMALLVKK